MCSGPIEEKYWLRDRNFLSIDHYYQTIRFLIDGPESTEAANAIWREICENPRTTAERKAIVRSLKYEMAGYKVRRF